MDLTHNDVESILKLIDAAEHLEEIEIIHAGFRLHVVRNGSGSLRGSTQPATAVAPLTAPPVAAAAKAVEASPAAGVPAPKDVPSDVPEGAVAIRAPMLGVFYRASGPGEQPFVEVGQRVRADDTVCLIEVMKLFNSIRAGVDGQVVKITVENGALVEFDQALIYVQPAKGGT